MAEAPVTGVRGEVWAFEGAGVADAWLVVQHDALAHAPTVTALAVTRRAQRAAPPLTVPVAPEATDLGVPLWVKVTQVHTLPAADARVRLGRLPAELMRQVDAGLASVLGLSP